MVNFKSETRVGVWADFKARLAMHVAWTIIICLSWCVGEVYYV